MTSDLTHGYITHASHIGKYFKFSKKYGYIEWVYP